MRFVPKVLRSDVEMPFVSLPFSNGTFDSVGTARCGARLTGADWGLLVERSLNRALR